MSDNSEVKCWKPGDVSKKDLRELRHQKRKILLKGRIIQVSHTKMLHGEYTFYHPSDIQAQRHNFSLFGITDI